MCITAYIKISDAVAKFENHS